MRRFLRGHDVLGETSWANPPITHGQVDYGQIDDNCATRHDTYLARKGDLEPAPWGWTESEWLTAAFDDYPFTQGGECDRWYLDEVEIRSWRYRWYNSTVPLSPDLAWDAAAPASFYGERLEGDVELKNVKYTYR